MKRSLEAIDLYEASLETTRYAQLEAQGSFVEYLRNLYSGQNLDLVVAMGVPATRFAQRYRPQFFPSTPLLIASPERRMVNESALTPNDAVVAVKLEFSKWIEHILQVLPATNHIAWAVGASTLERSWTEEFRRASQSFTDRVTFEWFNDLSFEGMLKRAAALPSGSAIFFVDVRVDARGVTLDTDSVLPRLREATNAPIFSYVEDYLGHGIVGGPLLSSKELGRRIATAALRILGGESPSDIRTPPLELGSAVYDWRELQHWNISEAHLPTGSTILFREATEWEKYHWQLIAAFLALLTQTAMIAWLLMERHGRRAAQSESRRRSIEVMRLKRAEEQQRTLLAELDHRTKNVLATVSAIARQTKDASNTMDGFVAALDGRIKSMASTHELLSGSRWEGVPLRQLLQRELAPYASDSNTCIRGPEVVLRAEAAQITASVLHELCTNAAKHGALSKSEGRVSIRWHRTPNGQAPGPLTIEWLETGGPPVEVPRNSGYGSCIITEHVPYELGGTARLVFSSEGVRCRLEIPAKWLVPAKT